MSAMAYITPGLTKIDFEDSLFVLTDVGRDNTKGVQELIESRGGIVKGAVTKSTNYLVYGDGEEETTKYKKALELINDKGLEINVLPFSLFKALCRGEGIVEFGSYPTAEDGSRRPILWNILKRKENKVLLFSAYGLDAKPYNDKWIVSTWETCTLRKWLNEEFHKTAFTGEEQKRILMTKIENKDNPKYKYIIPGGNDTEDKVFLLSLSEVEQYLPTAIERQVAPTPYAVKQGVFKCRNSNCWWLLRSPGRDSHGAAGVYFVGNIGDYALCVGFGRDAVCPALWIDLESEI